MNPAFVFAAHHYLRSIDLGLLSKEAFRRNLAESEVYRSLPLEVGEPRGQTAREVS